MEELQHFGPRGRGGRVSLVAVDGDVVNDRLSEVALGVKICGCVVPLNKYVIT